MYIISRLAVFIAVLFLFVPPLHAEVLEYTLKNGMKVLMAEDHKSPLAIFQIWYRVGSMDEVAGRSGISHLLEHMMFKGTPEYGSKVLSQTVRRYGGMDNAFTSKDYTAYFQVLPSDRIGLSIEFESDRMQNLILAEEETMAERDVVMEERRLRYEDDPQSSLYELTVAAAFNVHPYRRPIIGWMNDLASISRQDLLEHYKAAYSPDNAFIVVVGDITPNELIKDIRGAFSEIEPGGAKRRDLVSQEPPQKGQRRVYLKKEAELPYMLAAYHAPSIPDADAYALDVLGSILSGGKSGRLYKSLVYEKKIALDAFADYSGVYKDPYLFILGGTASPGNGISAVEEALYEEVEKIKNTPPSGFEVQKAKNQIESDFIMGQDSIFYQAMLLGRFEALGDWRLRDGYLEQVRNVTAGDVSRVARAYLTEENRTVGILLPQKNQENAGR